MTYRYLLTTSELLDALKLQRESTATDKWGKFFVWIAATGFCVVVACAGFFYLRWIEKETLRWAALFFIPVIVVAVLSLLVLSIIPIIGLFRNPAKDMAIQIDLEADIDFQFMIG